MANEDYLKRRVTIYQVSKESGYSLATVSRVINNKSNVTEETKKKIEILESYLPKQLSAEEIKEAIEKILSEKGLEPVKKSQGVVMKEMMAQYKGQVDGKLVNQVLGTLLH